MSIYDSSIGALDPTVFALLGAHAGDAAEMETRLSEQLVAGQAPNIADLVLSGAGEGPGWDAVLVNTTLISGALARTGARVAAAVGGSRQEAYVGLQSRLAALNTESAFSVVGKVEVQGGGEGSNFMALAIIGEAAV